MHYAREVHKQSVTGAFDAIIGGGTVNAGEYQSSVREFVTRNRDLVERVPAVFFSVSLTAADADAEAGTETHMVRKKFYRETGWQPQRAETIAGALAHTRDSVFFRRLIRLIAKQQGRVELDASRDHDITDWEAVALFACSFTAAIAEDVPA
jgi:menaquinone-dependent protoporphyrinogen oxidase